MAKRAKFLTDDPDFRPSTRLFFPGPSALWYGVVIRSQDPHAKILGVSHPPLPAGWSFLLAQDLPGHAQFQILRSRFPVLQNDEIQYVGEPIALVAGPKEREVRDWASRVRFITRPITWDEFSEDALHKTQKQWTNGDKKASAAGVSGTVEVEGVYTSGAQDHGHLDPVEVMVWAKQEEVAVRVKTQWPSHVVSSVARALDRDPHSIKVLGKVSAGTSNSQVWFPSLLSVYAAVLSQHCGKPVVLRLTKEEEFMVSPKRPESRTLLRTTLAPDGQILRFEADVVIQVGAYGIFDEEMVDRVAVSLLMPYRLEHYAVRVHAEISHTPPRGPVGGLGEALGQFALESHVLDLCRAIGQDPSEWRLLQTRVQGSLSFSGQVLRTDLPSKALITEAIRATDFRRKHAAYELLQERLDRFQDEALPFRGIGLATAFQGNGFLAGGTSPVSIEGRWEPEGRLSLYIPIVTANNRSVQLWKTSAAAALQIPEDDVRICPLFSGMHPTGGPSMASRSFEIVPKLLLQVCEGIAQKRLRQSSPLSVRKIYRRSRGAAWDSGSLTGQPFLSTSWAAAVAEIELLPLMAEIRIRKITLWVDAGPRVDEASARNALMEGAQMAVGWAITENIKWENQRISHESFLRYRLPGPRELPPMEIYFLESQKDSHPRGLGSLGANVVAPALLSAIRQAVGPELKSIPVSRRMLDEALRYHEISGNSQR